ncbi:MAG: YkgJ family cysteine cluster protein [Deltaproteobacteria bacterium]|nr:YkgJ family cysteine cluster protein [Deltaproteobacteria bacterium]
MGKPSKVSLYQQEAPEALSLESKFQFHCHAGLACFNQCCRTPTILLSPYDLLRLKQALKLSTGEILARYTITGSDEASNLPLVFVDAFSADRGGCPFLSQEGCKVYQHRPAACRLFPITMGSQLTEHGIMDHYFCRRLTYCRGFAAGREWTVASWQEDQGFKEFDQGRREWLEILLQTGLKGPVTDEIHEMVMNVAYDLDKFRRMIKAGGLPIGYDLADHPLPELLTDDLALLKFSYRHLKSIL